MSQKSHKNLTKIKSYIINFQAYAFFKFQDVTNITLKLHIFKYILTLKRGFFLIKMPFFFRKGIG
jgi:hypothetical protein